MRIHSFNCLYTYNSWKKMILLLYIIYSNFFSIYSVIFLFASVRKFLPMFPVDLNGSNLIVFVQHNSKNVLYRASPKRFYRCQKAYK